MSAPKHGARAVHVVLPQAVADLTRPSGGNAYDARVCCELSADGWAVTEHLVSGSWPQPTAADLTGLGAGLDAVPLGATVLVDGLLASAAPEQLRRAAERLVLVPLVHMPFGFVGNDGLPAAASVFVAESAALHACRAVVTTSEWTRDWVLGAYCLDPRAVSVARPGTDPATLAPREPAGTRLLCVGPVSRLKGYDVLLDALERLTDLPWGLRCAGSLDVDPACATDTLQRIAEGPLAGRVELLGALPPDRLASQLAAADLLVSASRTESYGMALAEALARGIPAVATDVGGVREAVGATVSGQPAVLVPSGDPTALATALRAWLTDAALRERLRDAARDRRETLPTWASTARGVAAALEPHLAEVAA